MPSGKVVPAVGTWPQVTVLEALTVLGPTPTAPAKFIGTVLETLRVSLPWLAVSEVGVLAAAPGALPLTISWAVDWAPAGVHRCFWVAVAVGRVARAQSWPMASAAL